VLVLKGASSTEGSAFMFQLFQFQQEKQELPSGSWAEAGEGGGEIIPQPIKGRPEAGEGRQGGGGEARGREREYVSQERERH